jgi:hypothetical protein
MLKKRGRPGCQISELGGEIAVDLETDAEFDKGRSCPSHDDILHFW